MPETDTQQDRRRKTEAFGANPKSGPETQVSPPQDAAPTLRLGPQTAGLDQS
jgi:hypothetical protein